MGYFQINSIVAILTICLMRSRADDQVLSLPGLDFDIQFKQYAGYLEVNNKTGKRLFYWLVESEKTPSTDPVVFWTNGPKKNHKKS
jgi:hypothetical protein